MSLETKLNALATATGSDIKTLTLAIGTLSGLSTTAKTNLVAAINEVYALALAASGSGAAINDSATDGDTTVTWSADKIFDEIAAAKAALRSELTAGAATALDTFAEFATAINNDPSFAATLATQFSFRVRVDAAQTFDSTQKAQGRDNIGAASASDLSTLVTGLGNYDADLVAVYNAAKA